MQVHAVQHSSWWQLGAIERWSAHQQLRLTCGLAGLGRTRLLGSTAAGAAGGMCTTHHDFNADCERRKRVLTRGLTGLGRKRLLTSSAAGAAGQMCTSHHGSTADCECKNKTLTWGLAGLGRKRLLGSAAAGASGRACSGLACAVRLSALACLLGLGCAAAFASCRWLRSCTQCGWC